MSEAKQNEQTLHRNILIYVRERNDLILSLIYYIYVLIVSETWKNWVPLFKKLYKLTISEIHNHFSVARSLTIINEGKINLQNHLKLVANESKDNIRNIRTLALYLFNLISVQVCFEILKNYSHCTVTVSNFLEE